MKDVVQHAFGVTLPAPDQPQPARYDMRSKHAAVFGGNGHYMATAQQVLDGVRAFAAGEGWVRP